MKKFIRNAAAHCLAIAITFCLAFSVVSCGVIERVGEWVNENPVVVELAVSQGVARYIESGETPAAIDKRRDDLLYRLSLTLEFIDISNDARADEVFDVFMASVDWESLSVADRLLAESSIGFVQQYIDQRIANGELREDAVLSLRGIVNTAINTARYF